MTQEIRFPFQLRDAFFTSLELKRIPELPEPLELKLEVEARIYDEKFPDLLQVDLKVSTPGEQPLMLSVQLVGIFDLVEEQPKPDRSIIPKFVNERALYILWPYVTQIVRTITSQMGTNPINVNTPFEFFWKLPEGETIESSEEEKMD